MALGDDIRNWTLNLIGVRPEAPPAATDEWGDRYVRAWATILNTNSLGGVTAQIISAAVAGVSFIQASAQAMVGQVAQRANARYRPNTLSGADAIAAWKTGHISPTAVVEYLRLNGYSEDAIGAMTAAAYSPLPPDVVRELENRSELNPGEFDQELKANGWTVRQIELFRKLLAYQPTASDVITWMYHEVFEPGQIDDLRLDEGFDALWPMAEPWARKAGVTREVARNYYISAAAIPSPEQAFEMFHRKAIGQPQLEAILKARDYPPSWFQAFLAISYNQPTLVDIRRGLQIGVLTPAQVEEQLQKRGLSPDDARWLTQFYVQLVSGTLTSTRRKELSTAAILAALDDGLLTASEADTELRGLKYSDDDAELLVQDAVYKREVRIMKLWVTATKSYYAAGDIDDNDLRQMLVSYGMPDDEAHALSEDWISNRYATGDKLSEAQIKDAIEKGLLEVSEAVTELRRRGVTTRQIRIKLLLWDAPPEEVDGALGLAGETT